MFFGLIFRDSAKTKRSILTWRDEKKSVLPQTDASTLSSGKGGYGFGRQGEKTAARNGMSIL